MYLKQNKFLDEKLRANNCFKFVIENYGNSDLLNLHEKQIKPDRVYTV